MWIEKPKTPVALAALEKSDLIMQTAGRVNAPLHMILDGGERIGELKIERSVNHAGTDSEELTTWGGGRHALRDHFDEVFVLLDSRKLLESEDGIELTMHVTDLLERSYTELTDDAKYAAVPLRDSAGCVVYFDPGLTPIGAVDGDTDRYGGTAIMPIAAYEILYSNAVNRDWDRPQFLFDTTMEMLKGLNKSTKPGGHVRVINGRHIYYDRDQNRLAEILSAGTPLECVVGPGEAPKSRGQEYPLDHFGPDWPSYVIRKGAERMAEEYPMHCTWPNDPGTEWFLDKDYRLVAKVTKSSTGETQATCETTPMVSRMRNLFKADWKTPTLFDDLTPAQRQYVEEAINVTRAKEGVLHFHSVRGYRRWIVNTITGNMNRVNKDETMARSTPSKPTDKPETETDSMKPEKLTEPAKPTSETEQTPEVEESAEQEIRRLMTQLNAAVDRLLDEHSEDVERIERVRAALNA